MEPLVVVETSINRQGPKERNLQFALRYFQRTARYEYGVNNKHRFWLSRGIIKLKKLMDPKKGSENPNLQ